MADGEISRAKLRLEGDGGLVEGLEALALGITGKRLLWRALSAVQDEWPQLQRFNLGGLECRAAQQVEQTDFQRVTEASRVFKKRVEQA